MRKIVSLNDDDLEFIDTALEKLLSESTNTTEQRVLGKLVAKIKNHLNSIKGGN